MALNKIQNIGGGIQLVDINPDKDTSGYNIVLISNDASVSIYTLFNVNGYKKFALYYGASINVSYYFVMKDGTSTSPATLSLGTSWSSYVDIPQNAKHLYMKNASTGDRPLMSISVLT